MRKRCPNGSRKKNATCVKYTKRRPNGSRKKKGKFPSAKRAYASPENRTPYSSPENTLTANLYASPENKPVLTLPKQPEYKYNRRENLLRLHRRIHRISWA
jgi:hypothetical protein